MLVLKRTSGEKVTIFAGGEKIEIAVVFDGKKKSCKMIFDSSSGVKILRNELLEQVQQNAEQKSAQGQAEA